MFENFAPKGITVFLQSVFCYSKVAKTEICPQIQFAKTKIRGQLHSYRNPLSGQAGIMRTTGPPSVTSRCETDTSHNQENKQNYNLCILYMFDREIVVRLLTGAKYLSLLLNVQSGSEDQPASYSVGSGNLSPGIKWQGCEADLSPPSNAKFRNKWSYNVKFKVFPLKASAGPWESGRIRLRIFLTFGSMKGVRSSPLRTGRLYPQEYPGTHF